MIETAIEEDHQKHMKEIMEEDDKLQREEPELMEPEVIDVDESKDSEEGKKRLVKRLGKK